nr:piriformospora indica-insensitive protein 2 [Ipomoea batatas]
MPKLKEVYLSGNKLGGGIPKIWENMGGLQGIGLSGMGLVENIPVFVGVYEKLKLHGNPLLCVDEGLRSAKVIGSLGNLKLCTRHYTPKSAPLSNSSPILICFDLISISFVRLPCTHYPGP